MDIETQIARVKGSDRQTRGDRRRAGRHSRHRAEGTEDHAVLDLQ